MIGSVDRLRDRLAALVPAAQVLRRAVIGLQPGKGEVRCLGDMPPRSSARTWLTSSVCEGQPHDIAFCQAATAGIAMRSSRHHLLVKMVNS